MNDRSQRFPRNGIWASLGSGISSNYVVTRFLVGEHHRAAWLGWIIHRHVIWQKHPGVHRAECDLRLVSVEHAPGIIFRLIRVTNQRNSYGILKDAFRVFERDAIYFPTNIQRYLSILW